MIVKKTPILQGFGNLQAICKLLEYALELSDTFPVFYDIETTGLSRKTSSVYLIGAAACEDGCWQLYQWFAEAPHEEEMVLRFFSEFIHSCSYTIQYNGDAFDQPFVSARCGVFGLPDPFTGKASLDLYKTLKPLKNFLKLPAMKQPDLEKFLEYTGRENPDGGECIRLYRAYTKSRSDAALSRIIGHNREDILGLGKIIEMLGYLCLYQNDYYIKEVYTAGEQLVFQLQLPVFLPQEISAGGENFYLTGKDDSARILITPKAGYLQRFYENYRDYDYIPGEDMAIPKSLSAFMDRSLRKPATRETCYTWFSVNEVFLSDKKMQTEYLAHALPVLLGSLGK